MERRGFIGLSFTGLLAAPAAAAGGPGRLFDAPESITGPQDGLQDSLVLSLERLKLDVGEEASRLMVATARVWTEVLTDDREREGFHRNPRNYLVSRGIPAEVAVRSKADVNLLRAACSAKGRRLLERGDMRGYLKFLKASGLGTGFQSEIGQALRDLVNKDREAFRTLVSHELEKNGIAPGQVLLTDADLELLTSAVSAKDGGESQILGCTAVIVCIAGALVAVAIAAIAALYVSVGTALTVAILAAAAISVLFEVAVTVSTDSSAPQKAGDTPRALAVKGHLHRMQGYGQAYDTFRRAARAAEISGAKNATIDLIKAFVAEEVRAVVDICEELDLVRIDPKAKDIVVGEAIVRCHRAAGLLV